MAKIRSFPNNQDEYIGAEDVMRWLHGRSSGVFGAEGNASVSPVLDTMKVTVSDGNGWITNDKGDGIVWWVDNEAKSGAKLELAVDIADAVLPRIDRVVVSWQTTNYVDLPDVIIVKGTPASTPVAPALTNDNMVRQISLAAIRIPAGVTSIDASMITDERLDGSVCGIVTEKVGVDTSVMKAQFESFISKSIDEQNAYLEQQKAAWEAFFANVEMDTLVPVPTAADKGKAVVVNENGDGYALGGAQTEIPVTSEIPADSDIWIDPTSETLEGSHIGNRNNPHKVTAEQVGARPNTWVPTPAQVGAYPAKESTEHPGCYYRLYEGVTEWINPPLEIGVEYRTVRRYTGRPVYIKRMRFGNLASSGYKYVEHGVANGSMNIVSCKSIAYLNDDTCVFPIYANGSLAAYYYINNTQIGVNSVGSVSSYIAHFEIEYVK